MKLRYKIDDFVSKWSPPAATKWVFFVLALWNSGSSYSTFWLLTSVLYFAVDLRKCQLKTKELEEDLAVEKMLSKEAIARYKEEVK